MLLWNIDMAMHGSIFDGDFLERQKQWPSINKYFVSPKGCLIFLSGFLGKFFFAPQTSLIENDLWRERDYKNSDFFFEYVE